MNALQVLQAATALAPLAQELVMFWQGGPKPAWMAALPETLQSELALARRRAERPNG
jgi:hypothetical protein